MGRNNDLLWKKGSVLLNNKEVESNKLATCNTAMARIVVSTDENEMNGRDDEESFNTHRKSCFFVKTGRSEELGVYCCLFK